MKMVSGFFKSKTFGFPRGKSQQVEAGCRLLGKL
jgi:hypothetical protein